MFYLDPLLFKKHPKRYLDLICREGHYRQTTGYWSNFVRGMADYNVEPPLYSLFERLRLTDPGWWSAVQDGTNMTNFCLDRDDIAALDILLQRLGMPAFQSRA